MLGYTRASDYATAAVVASAGPALMLTWEKLAPSYVGKGGFAPIMRLTGFVGLTAGFLTMYQRSIRTCTHDVFNLAVGERPDKARQYG